MCQTSDMIRECAAKGMNKKQTYTLLGINKESFNNMVDLLGVKFFRNPPYTVRGFTGTISQVIAHFKIKTSPQAIWCRLNRGADPEVAFFEKPSYYKFTLRGVTGSINDLRDALGIPLNEETIRSRLGKGLSIEEAFFTPLRGPKQV